MGGAGDGLIILGLDPGSRVTGFGLVREAGGRLDYLDAGTIRLDPRQDAAKRLGVIFERVSELIERFGPAEAAIENVFVSRNTQSALKLGQARGAAMAACASRGLDVFSYEPTKVKKNLVGVGRAEKFQVAFMLGRLLGVPADWKEDASDALALAVCHLSERRLARLLAGR